MPPDSDFLQAPSTSCWLWVTSRMPPLPAAHPPLRPGSSLLRCWLPVPASTRVLKVEAILMRDHRAAAAAGISSAASKVEPAAASPAGPAWSHSPAGHPLDTGCSIPVSWSPPRGWGPVWAPGWALRTQRHQSSLSGEEEFLETLWGLVLCTPQMQYVRQAPGRS